MTFLLDHCIWRETENILRKGGNSCITLRELDKTEAANGKIIAIAKERKAVLITRDRGFSNLSLYPLGTHQGIIVLRITPKTMDDAHRVLLEALRTISSAQIKGNLLVVNSTTYRLHKHKT